MANQRNRTGPRKVACSGTAALLSAESTSRKVFVVQNPSTTVSLKLGGSNVATSGANEGIEVKPGTTFTDQISASEWWAVTSDGSSVSPLIFEVF